MLRIGFFGGSFDPPHTGHLALAYNALVQKNLDQVLWVLTPQSPLKTTVFSSVEQRKKMVEFFTQTNPAFVMSDVDIERKPPFFTVDTARMIRLKYAEPIQLFFIIGGDSLRSMVKWHKAHELVFEQVDGLIVAHRPEDELDLSEVENFFPSISQRLHWIDMPAMAVSSHSIRQAIYHQQDPSDHLLPDLLAYIKEQNLYTHPMPNPSLNH